MYDCIYHYTSDASSSPQLASSTCALSTTTPAIATTSDIVIVPSITAGEVLIAFFLFVLILVLLAASLMRALDRIVTKRKIIRYSTGDVPVENDI